MKSIDAIQYLRHRLSNRADTEHTQIVIRTVIVSLAMLYFFSDFFAIVSSDPANVVSARWAVSIAFVITIGLAIALVISPRTSVPRRIVGIFHDVTAVSIALFLGESLTTSMVAIYFWISIGNGFRYGSKYLCAGAALSLAEFSGVYFFSDYWRQHGTLSITVLIMLVAIPPYVGRLLASLHKAQAQLKYQASIDGLTGLLNRAELVQGIEASLALQHGGHFLLYCDLDHFKELNDAAGHAAGDKLLVDIAQIIESGVRGDDLVARLGGDEFCVFIRNCPPDRVREIAESIRNSVAGYRLAWGTEYFSVGISIGAAPSSAVNDVKSLFRLADAGCYAAKNAGRNQVHIVDPCIDVADTQAIRMPFSDRKSGQRQSSSKNRQHSVYGVPGTSVT